MTVEELKKLGLDDEQAKKVAEAVDGEYVKSGNYIPKAKFDQVLAEKNQLKAQVDQSKADLAKLEKGAGDNEALRKTIEDLQKQHKELDAKHKAELLELRKRSAIMADLAPIAHNPSDVVGFVDLSKVSVDDNGAIVGGWDEQKAELLKSKSYMFKATPNTQQNAGAPNILGNPAPNPQAGGKGSANDDPANQIAAFAKSVAKEAATPKFGSDTYFGGKK